MLVDDLGASVAFELGPSNRFTVASGTGALSTAFRTSPLSRADSAGISPGEAHSIPAFVPAFEHPVAHVEGTATKVLGGTLAAHPLRRHCHRDIPGCDQPFSGRARHRHMLEQPTANEGGNRRNGNDAFAESALMIDMDAGAAAPALRPARASITAFNALPRPSWSCV